MSITLTALTPLIVGNEHYEANSNTIRIDKVTVPRDKKIIEPLRLPLPDVRVVLSGGSLNGMIRHSLAALLSAPMERVAERVYSYRPNLGGLTPNKDACLEARPAVIEGWDGDKLKVKVLKDLQCVYFSEPDFEDEYDANQSLYSLGCTCNIPNTKLHTFEVHRIEKRHFKKHDSPLTDWCLFSYVGGVDACGVLNRLFRKNFDAGLHRFAAVSGESFKAGKQNCISHECIRQNIASLKQLCDDQTGHLADHPLLKGDKDKKLEKDIQNYLIEQIEKQLRDDKIEHHADHPLLKGDINERLKKCIQIYLNEQINLWSDTSPNSDLVNRLIFVEIDTHTNKIKSFGHNFLYRWRYADSVRLQNDEVRAILEPREYEQVDKNAPEKHIPPVQLSGVRLLCGYTSKSKRNDKPEQNEGSDNIGKGRYQRLKGRIVCNFAVEYWGNGVQSKDDNERFLPGIGNRDFFIPLKPLGKPRPSAVEHYLRQPQDGQALKTARNGDRAGLRTYGDLKGVDKPGDLAGRKFYLHQPDAAKVGDEACYVCQDQQYITGDSYKQTSLARFVSRHNTKFRFTLNFNDFRQWEMGALLVTLEPSEHLFSLVEKLAAKDSAAFEPLKKKLKSLSERATQLSPAFESSEGKCGNKKSEKATQSPPAFAHKLGLARPLGFGSVLLKVDKPEQIGVDENGLPTPKEITTTEQDKCIAAFTVKLMESAKPEALADHLEHWAAIHRYAGLTRAEYPTKRGTPIFKHHSNIRREHMEKRRLAAQGDANDVNPDVLNPASLSESVE